MGTIAKVNAGGSTHLIASTCYGTCPTEANTKAKVATIQDSQEFALLTGVTIHIKFTYANTATSPTLNVNNTGAIAIKTRGTTFDSVPWMAGSVVSLTYDSTYWMINNFTSDTNDSVQQTNTTDNKDYRVILSGVDSDSTQTGGVKKSSKLTFNPSLGELKSTKLTVSTSVNGQSAYFTDELYARWIAVKDGNNTVVDLFEADGTDLILSDDLVLGIQNSVFKKVWTNSDPHTAHDYSTDTSIIINDDNLSNYTKVRIDFFPVHAVYNMTSQYFDLPTGSTYPIESRPVAFGTYLTMCYRNIALDRTSATQLEITWSESGKFATYGSSTRTAGTAFMIPATIYLTN